MRIVLLALATILTAHSAVAQTPFEKMTAMINESIRESDRDHEREREYQRMRQDYIEDSKQAMREYQLEQQLLKEPEPFDITLPGMGKKRRNFDDED